RLNALFQSFGLSPAGFGVASFVCPPPSSSLPPTPPHLLGRRRRRRSTARGAPPSLPSSLASDPPPSPGRPSFLLSLASPARPLPCSGTPAAGPWTTSTSPASSSTGSTAPR